MDLEERVELLTECVLNNCQFSKLALSFGWEENTRKEIFNIMDKYFYNKSQNYSYGDIENDFNSIGINYQYLKLLFLMFYENRQYVPVIKQYLATNYEAYGNVSGEYVEIYNELF